MTIQDDDSIKDGLIQGVPYYPSPNQNERPEGINIDLVVIHSISLPPGQFSGTAVIDFFQNKLEIDQHPYYQNIKDLKVSTHLMVRRDGSVLQFVPFHRRAWHAGASSFNGVKECNDYSIGIELEGTDDTSYEMCQYQSLAHVLRLLQKQYPMITPQRIVGHCDVAPGRKTDPGPHFDWKQLQAMLREELCT